MTNAAESYIDFDPLLDLLDQQLERVSKEARLPSDLLGGALYAPVREFLARPRRGLRASLVEAGWYLGGGSGHPPAELPQIVEVLHAGSLIIDDIEDAALLRRARPALHQLHGVPLALNAGNWLYFWAMALLDAIPGDHALHAELYRLTTRTFLACHHGQALDLGLNVATMERRQVPSAVLAISRLKTAALVEYGLLLGARAAGADRLRLAQLARLGTALGVSIQMLDDLGGLTREDRCLKGHEDLLNGRATWPWAWLAEGCETWDELTALSREVRGRETHPEILAERLRDALGDRGRDAVRSELATTLSILDGAFERSAVSVELRSSIAALEATYA